LSSLGALSQPGDRIRVAQAKPLRTFQDLPARSIGNAALIGIVLSSITFLAGPAFARAHTDVIVMRNGDRITGEVKDLQAGILKVDLDYVDGTISVDWGKVARIESSALFLVQLKDGTIYSGKIVTPKTDIPVKIAIYGASEEPVEVDKSEVVRLSQTFEDLWRRFGGSITIGSQFSKGNNATQYNIGSDLEYQASRWGGRLTQSSSLSASTGAETSTRNQVDLAVYRFLPWNNYFYGGHGGFLQSSVQGVQRQITAAGVLGRYFVNTNRVRFSVAGGFGWQGTDYTPSAQSEQSQNLGVALIVANLDAFSFKRTKIDFSASLAPALTDAGRYFSRVNAAYYVKVFGKIDWNLSFYGNWDTKPPAHLQSSDYGTSTGLSYTFGSR
jgi:Protein of unknown function, DUF481